jgi:hypothetical protein
MGCPLIGHCRREHELGCETCTDEIRADIQADLIDEAYERSQEK